MKDQLILVTGATGYIGGRLVPRLLEAGYRVRAVGRSLDKLKGRYWSSHPHVELMALDVLNYEQLKEAVRGCSVAYYFVHSMVREQKDFTEADRLAALNFVAAAEMEGLERIIYLGGLGNERDRLSKHLQSRKEVGEIFRQGAVPTTIFQAAMIIGSGSASFEILRYLTDRLPVMVTPRWVRTQVQPIAIANVLEYLIKALEVPETRGQTFDIGGPSITTYEELMLTYAEVAGLPRRYLIRVPLLTPHLSSLWIGLVTPLPPRLGKLLVEGLSNKVVCEDSRVRFLIPQRLLNYREAISRALDIINENTIETSWSDAGLMPPVEWADPQEPHWAGGTIFQDHHQRVIPTSPENVWKTILQIGGKKGWYSASWLWKIRGAIDKLVGGVGLRRGRRDRENLLPGDALDFWRVKEVSALKKLVFVAEMKLPGKAILEFKLTKQSENSTLLEQKALFLPKGLFGILYWYSLVPFHLWIFKGMLKRIEKESCLNI